MKKAQVLPHTPWAAKSLWAFEPKSFSVLLLSLSVMGFGEALLLLSDLGSAPWTILSQGVALHGEFSVGWASWIISSIVMLAWFPLKLRPGLATVMNIFVIALFLGLTVYLLEKPTALYLRFTYAVVGILLFGIGNAFYLTCHQGPGPRDGLMVGLCYHFHWKIGIVRTSIEVLVCLFGYLLGGVLGIGTLMFALGIGWVVQYTLFFIRCRVPHLNDKPRDLL